MWWWIEESILETTSGPCVQTTGFLPDMKSENSAALGVAILAAVGCGAYPSVVEACDKITKMRYEVYTPDTEQISMIRFIKNLLPFILN